MADDGSGQSSGQFDRESVLIVEDDTDVGSVLIIDDNAEFGRLLSEALRAERIRAAYVSDPEQALQSVFREKVDLIVTEMVMERIDGIALIRRIRQEPSLRDTRIVAMSDRLDRFHEALESGANACVEKMMSISLTVAVIGRYLQMARWQRPAQRAG